MHEKWWQAGPNIKHLLKHVCFIPCSTLWTSGRANFLLVWQTQWECQRRQIIPVSTNATPVRVLRMVQNWGHYQPCPIHRSAACSRLLDKDNLLRSSTKGVKSGMMGSATTVHPERALWSFTPAQLIGHLQAAAMHHKLVQWQTYDLCLDAPNLH